MSELCCVVVLCLEYFYTYVVVHIQCALILMFIVKQIMIIIMRLNIITIYHHLGWQILINMRLIAL